MSVLSPKHGSGSAREEAEVSGVEGCPVDDLERRYTYKSNTAHTRSVLYICQVIRH